MSNHPFFCINIIATITFKTISHKKSLKIMHLFFQLSIYSIFPLVASKFFLLSKDTEHSCVCFLIVRHDCQKKLNQTSAIKQKFFSREILDSNF